MIKINLSTIRCSPCSTNVNIMINRLKKTSNMHCQYEMAMMIPSSLSEYIETKDEHPCILIINHSNLHKHNDYLFRSVNVFRVNRLMMEVV